MAIYLPVGSLLYFDTSATSTPSWQKISEHNRQPMSITHNRIQKVQRMSNGTMRKLYIADKETISVSWTMLPSFDTYTVDAGQGALDLKAFYDGDAEKASGTRSGRTSFNVDIKYGGETKTMEMVFTSFSLEVVKRNVKQKTGDPAQEFWNLSITLEEV